MGRARSATDGNFTCRRSAKLARLEAVLFVADGALSTRKLARLATLVDAAEARRLIDRLNRIYDERQTAFRVERVAGGYRLMTRPQFAPWLFKLYGRPPELALSAPALETLTIVAYQQPVTRAEIERIRGVQSTEILRQLMDRGLIRIGGEDPSLGRPFLYVTTTRFLEAFGLKSLDDLPMADRLRRRPSGSSSADKRTAEDAAAAAESGSLPQQADDSANPPGDATTPNTDSSEQAA